MTRLAGESCVLVRGDVLALSKHEIDELKVHIPGWKMLEVDGIKRLERKFEFKDFKGAIAFTNKVGESAEAQDHHPALLTEWGAVTVTWWTHSVKGLHRNDFIMAARTDELFAN
jgi:4a-hydroxytetrahydrobiopterin dehydratase